MGEQSATRLKGDDYQHLYSWFELLQLMQPASPYAYGYVEHPWAGAADDITLHPSRPTVPAKYIQVKFHVDQRAQYSPSSLVESSQDNVRSLLHKLFDSWDKLRKQGASSIEIWLVSNWASEVGLGKFIHDSYVLTEEFFSSGSKTEAAKVRKLWARKLGIDAATLLLFCRALRLRLGFSGLNELVEKLDDRMARFGLRTGDDPRAIVLDIVRGWIKDGGPSKKIDAKRLLDIIEQRNLKAEVAEVPRVSLWVHAWAKRAYDISPTLEIDWTKYFDVDARTVADQRIWDSVLSPELKNARQRLASQPNGTYVDVRGKLPLTASLAIGRVFSETFGFRFRVEQPSGGEVFLWDSNTGASQYELQIHEIDFESDSTAGLIAVSITGDASPETLKLIDVSKERFRKYRNILPVEGASANAVKSSADAVSIAMQVKEEIKRFRNQNGFEATHLVLYCPASVALFLGQRLNAVGDIYTYERALDGRYRPSVCLRTG